MSAHRFVIIGCGRMGLAHARRLSEDDRSSIVAFFDADAGAAERLHDEFAPDAVTCDSLEHILTAVDADAAVIATPTSCHYGQIQDVAANGWHVLCEKPLADTRERILELIALAESSEAHFMLGYQRRCWTVYRRLREEIQSGRHGAIKAVTSHNCERWQQTIAGTWRDDPGINSGGFLGDAGSHKIDILFFVTGLKPLGVVAMTGKCGSRVPIVSSVIGHLEGGVPLTMTFTGHAGSFHEELFVHCEDADLIVRDWRLWIGRDNRIDEIDLPANETGPQSVRNPVTEFLDVLSGEAENSIPFSCALTVLDFTMAILNSSRQNSTP